MSFVSNISPLGGPSPVKAIRTPASGSCGCARRNCWHQRQCRSSGYVRILRVPAPDTEVRTSVVLCRECAAPTQRKRVS
ncbi:MAG: hypothetical protein ABSG24_06120 [Acidimicrobiales bacterium]|jgi:hypothetical protein